MKILVIDDDPIVAKTLKLLLARYNHAVDIAADGETGLQMIDAFDYDLILLDVILPNLDGISLCQQLRHQGLQSPILLLTGQGEGGQKAIALNAGADGYAVKPFDADELIAQVHALLRRGNSATQPILAWGDLYVDPSSRNVTYGTHLLNLTPKEYAILELLLRNPQRVFSAEAMLDHAWNSVESPGEEAVRVHIKELRHKLRAVGAPRDFIKTVYRIGYRLNPLYSSILAEQTKTPLTPPQIAELQSVNQELRTALDQLQATQEELRHKNQELENAYQTIECERHSLQIAQSQLERRVVARTAELVQANQSLQQQQQFLSSIYEVAEQAIFVIDVTESQDFRYVSFNRLAQQYGKISHAEIQGQTPEAVFGIETGSGLRRNYERCLQTGKSISYEEHLLLENQAIWTLTTLSPLRNEQGEIYRIVGTAIDITDRKLAEQKVREQAALLNITSDAIFVHDLEHRILYWNQGAERLYGWQNAEAIDQQADQLLPNYDVQLETIIQPLMEQGSWRGEMRRLTKTGREILVEARWTLVRNQAGQPRFILAVETDITDKKNLEAQFYHAQRLESIGTLASGIAHDLNNVLTPILGIAQLLRLQWPDLTSRSIELLQVLEESAKRGTNMAKQILTFTRGSNGEKSIVQMVPLLQEVVKVIEQTFPKSIAIRQVLPASPVESVLADPAQLHQILMNLCINARDAMPSGGVLTLSLENAWVDQVFAQRNLNAQVGHYVVITIADTGIGISPDVRDRIFDPFFTTKVPSQGTGLGLSTVLGIVRNYGGFLQVSSEVQKGTQFKVYLPATEAICTEGKPLEKLLCGDGELVLIVDDDPMVRRTNQALLETYHYKTLTAKDGIEAIALYARNQDQIKAVLIDVIMPNMDGITAVRTLRGINEAVKIIAVSGLSSNRESTLAVGANVFLSKPYLLESLLENLYILVKT